MVHINQQIPPAHPDGWHFVDGGVILRGNSYRDLVAKVTEYRLMNRRGWESVQMEVNEYLAAVAPGSVGTSAHAERPVYQKQGSDMGTRVYNWLSRTYDAMSTGTAYCTAAEADRRSTICASCQHNVRADPGCGPCISQMKLMNQGIRKNRRTRSDNRLDGCAVLNYDLKAAVHLEDDVLGPRDVGGVPQICWRSPS